MPPQEVREQVAVAMDLAKPALVQHNVDCPCGQALETVTASTCPRCGHSIAREVPSWVKQQQ